MAKMNFRKNYCACRWSSNSMKYGQSWDAEAQARHNRKRRAGILTPEQELSATIHRQMEEDDLAERIENA